jgi:RNA polymerase sigma factor (sigma-70 family)
MSQDRDPGKPNPTPGKAPDPVLEHPETDHSENGVIAPGTSAARGKHSDPLAHPQPQHQPHYQQLIDRLNSEAVEYSWALPRARFQAALERSAAKRFNRDEAPLDKLEEYWRALHLRDLCLAAACADGHADAWDYFVATYRSYLRSAAASILHCPAGSTAAHDLADSLFADLFGLSAAEQSERSLFRYFHGRSSLRTWLRAVLAQRHIDALRSARRFTELDENAVDRGNPKISRLPPDSGPPESPPDPHRQRYVALFTRTLQGALSLLDPRDRERLRLYYADQLTLAEIGRQLGEHESNVSRHLERVRRELRSSVEGLLRTGRVAADGSQAEPALSDEQISLCFEYASEDAPVDLDKLFSSNGPGAERLEP